MAKLGLHALALGLALLVALAACGGPPQGASKGKDKGLLIIECALEDAEIWLDSRYFREVAEVRRGVRLRAGKHRVEVRHPDFHSMYFEVDIVDQGRKVLQVELAPRLH